MKNAVLKELVARWEDEAIEPEAMDGSPEAEVGNHIAQGERQAKRECADTLRMLMTVLPDFPDRSDSPASMN